VGDALRLEQVLQNLFQNAAKYSPAGSEILVRLALCGDQVQISVSDRGIGIPVDDQPALFQRFFRAGSRSRRSVAGLGLGLYICKAIMDLHGGTIAVESAEGKGCTVALLLPRSQAQARD
jgi:signal transduction histidine kinase